MLRIIQSIMLVVLLSLPAAMPTHAEINRTDSEIQYLLRFISQSNCIFIRNGEEHKSQKAREHIERKYDYYRNKVNSAEDFIKYAATKSGFSGKKYMARCNGKTIPSSQWLLHELSVFRKQQNPNK
ncbi:MAG: DUF5329 family protein [Thiohalomonadales bacterium]